MRKVLLVILILLVCVSGVSAQGFIYAGGATTQKVWKIDPTDMTKVDDSDSYGGAIYALTTHDGYIYASGGTTRKVWKIDPTDMTKVGESDNYSGAIYALTLTSPPTLFSWNTVPIGSWNSMKWGE